MKMKRKCRIWWPKQILSCDSSSSAAVLFGWFVTSSSTFLDIVVAFAINEVSLPHFQSDLQEILHHINGNMPAFLQDKSKFSILGYIGAEFCCNGPLPGTANEEDDQIIESIHENLCKQNKQDIFVGENGRCRCRILDGLFEQCSLASSGHHNWVQLAYDCHESYHRDIHKIPKLHHIHWNGKIVSDCDLHVIVYETPRFGANHLSLSFLSSSDQVKTLKKPIWVDELHKKQPLLDLDMVILAMNCAAAANILFERFIEPKRSVNRFVAFTWQLLSVSIASFSIVFYIILQFLHYSLLSYASQSRVYIVLAKVFGNTWKNVQIRCSQILYWPILLQENDLRSQSCVEYAEKAALHKQSMWSSVAVDILLGNLIGFALLFHSKSICWWVLNIVDDITNNLLRVGCVWLMGVPAGFKLNTELATVLGMICLNAIQIWSTLWTFTSFLLSHFIRGLAISGIVFGVTIPAALIMDMIMLLTVHVSTLHWLLSILYSRQIQAIAALWRLFRGQKWNPLRQRLDSYDYTVEQHIVGSLLFTPLLLLLPTTSVFYIFFSLVNTTISVICMLIEISISVLHATPYIKIFFCLVRPGRFPSGIWFEIISCQNNAIDSPDTEHFDEIGLACDNSMKINGICESGSCFLVSALHSNFLKLGQVIFPHYRRVFSGVSRSLVLSSACGVFAGRRWACLFIFVFILCLRFSIFAVMPSQNPLSLSLSFSIFIFMTAFLLLWGLVFLQSCHGRSSLIKSIGSFAVIQFSHAWRITTLIYLNDPGPLVLLYHDFLLHVCSTKNSSVFVLTAQC